MKPKFTVKRSFAALLATMAVGLGGFWATNRPVVEAPVVEAPVVEAPVVEAPVVEAPAASVSLQGKQWIILALHFDGMKWLDAAGMSAWLTDAKEFATTTHSRGIPTSWEMTASEVNRIGNPAWFAEMRDLGATFAPRQPHQGDGTTADAIAALKAVNVPMANYVGSYTSTDEFIGGPFSVLTGGGTLGHASDPKWSGLRLAGFSDAKGMPVIIVGTGTGNSAAIKVKVAEYVRNGTYPYAVEVLRANGVSLDGKGENFVTPARHDGAQAPVLILDDIDKMTAELTKRGLTSYVAWTDYDTVVAGSRATGEYLEYVVPRTGE